ncbi:RPM1 interacting protein 13-like [Actinidia eriantha]|uniref:RPM1 interacting protein 13-like n=1 Tax=Actinidia eriantha TaxID=165200 RepID=UPI00258593FB|nr:RPM1 interacting protein 13-like [Actinidia eriantha]
MGKRQLKRVMELSPTPAKTREAIDLEGTPIREIFCLKKKTLNMREIEEREDCFILDFDPNDSLNLSQISKSKDLRNPNSPDLSILAEKGQVACRDYPHSRHLCAKNQFESTPHESYCELCYCFVCDMVAPCKDWTGVVGHCHAIDNEAWKSQRKRMRRRK